jgi:signal transduction histidine kinase/AmiR/NasT family two-component response regulator
VASIKNVCDTFVRNLTVLNPKQIGIPNQPEDCKSPPGGITMEALRGRVAQEMQGVSALYRSDPQFHRMLEKLPAGAYTCDSDGLITYFNQHAVQLWGRAPKLNDPVDRFCGSFKLFASDGSPIAHRECWMAQALLTGKEFNGHEIVIERPDGQRVTALAHANPIRDGVGKLLGAVNVLVDISDRKRHEDALKEADRSKNEFLATLAHELRNPLAPIRNAIEVLHLQDTPSPELQWALNVIDRQTQQMTRLIDDLLDVARITGNKLELRKERIELAKVLQAAVEISQPHIEERAHQFTVNAPVESIYLDGDLTRLAQVVSNLLNNAAKYTESGGHIWLTAERNDGHTVITVRDNGVGISAEMIPRVFDMFTQAKQSQDSSQSGLGVGLALVHRLVEMHGGTIKAHSDGPGRGSAFILRLPIAEAAQASPVPRRESESVTPASLLNILVVDDNHDSAESMDVLLRIMGNAVRTAHDGLEAFQMAAEFRPDVVLLDIGLPGIDGYEVARRIRQQRWGGRMILIAATGWGQETDRQRTKEAGFDYHLVKPLDHAALLNLLSSVEQARLARDIADLQNA